MAVQRITAEDPDVPSVACRDGTTEVLAISRDYTRFVDRGTGLVASLTGHGAYRLDLDRPVDGGRSWQLPVLLAHLLESEGRLAGPDEPAGLALLATGEVDRDQRVRRVGRIPEKLAAARDLIARHGDGGPPLVVMVPAADGRSAIEGALPAAGDPAAGRVRLIAWERVMGLAALEAPPADRPAPGRATPGDATDTDEEAGGEEGTTSGAPPAASDRAGPAAPAGAGNGRATTRVPFDPMRRAPTRAIRKLSRTAPWNRPGHRRAAPPRPASPATSPAIRPRPRRRRQGRPPPLAPGGG